MALDLSGFTIPEQKFEGLYKLGEELSAQRKAKEAAKVAEAKAAKEAADKLQANQDLNFKLLSEATDPNKWLTGDPTDPQMLKEVRGINDAATKFLNENPGASSSQLRQFLYPQVSKWSEKQILIKKIDENIKDQVGKLNPSFYNTNEATKRLKEKFFYKEDENGNLVEKDINEIQIDPTAYDEVFKKHGHELVNARGVLNVINKIPKTQTTTQVGKTTTTVSLYPWQKNVNGVTSVDTEPVQMTDENGNPINVDVIKDDAYRALLAYAPETNDYLNAQLNLVSSELGREVDPDSQEGMLYKKKLMTELLGETGGGKFSRTTKVFAPSKARTGGTGDATGGGQTTGNVLDEIGISQPLDTQSGARVQNGSVTTADGKPYNGNIYIEKKYFPSSLLSVLKAGGVEFKGAGATFDVVNGTIQNMRTPKGIVDRNTILNYQDKWNTESKNAPQPTFGAKAVDAAKGLYQKVKTAVTPKPSPKPSAYDANTQAKIKKFAEANKLSMDDAIKILKSKKLIK